MSTAVSSFWAQTDDSKALGVDGRRPVRQYVSAVLVSHNGERWLPRVLESLEAAERKPDALVAVDTGSTDRSVELLEQSQLVDRVVPAGLHTGFGEAAQLGLTAGEPTIDLTDSALDSAAVVLDNAAEGSTPGVTLGSEESGPDHADSERFEPAGNEQRWVWLLHDDCAVAPDTLKELLSAALANPDSWVVGPKVHRWRRRDVIVECGISYTRFGRKITGMEKGERDQGQYDHRSDVYAVGSAGMLVRRDVWERLSGFAASLPLFGDDHDFCYRVRRSGGQVLVATKAVVFHRSASASNKRKISTGPSSLIRSERRAANLIVLAHEPLWRLPFSMLRIALTGIVGAVLALAGLATGTAWDQLASAFGPIFSIRSLWSMRRQVARSAQVSRHDVRRQRKVLTKEGSYWQEAVPRFLDHGSNSSMLTIRRRTGVLVNWTAGVLLPLLIVSVLATRSLWVGLGKLHGGALLPAPDGVTQMWAGFVASWHEVGLGSDVASPPFLAVLSAVGIIFAGSTTAAVQVLLLLGPALAGATVFVALRGLATGLPRIAGSVAYGLAPAAVAAVGTGRLATTVVAIILPLVVRGMARISGVGGTYLPQVHWPTAAGVGLGLAVLAAFSPPVAILLVALNLLWAIFWTRRFDSVARVVIAGIAPLVLLWPWSGYLLNNPGLLLMDIGASSTQLSSSPAMPWQLLVLDPGGPSAPPTGLGVVLLALAIAASFNERTQKLVLLAWTGALAGLILGTWQLVTQVSVPSSAGSQSAWPGSATMVIAAAFVLLTVAAFAHPVADPSIGQNESSDPDDEWNEVGNQLEFRHSRGVIGPSIALVGALLIAGWWVLDQEQFVERSDAAAVSPFIAAEAFGPDAPRTLVLSGVGKNSYEYLLVSGVGPVLGDSETAPSAESIVRIDRAVSHLAGGGGRDDLRVLAEASVQYVQADTRRDRELSRQLDSVAGMSRVSTLEGQAVWEIHDWQSRARVTDSDGATSPVPVTFTDSGAVEVSTRIPDGDHVTGITLAEAANPLWRAVIRESAMEPEPESELQTFTSQDPGSGPADLTVSVDQQERRSALNVPAAGLLAILLAGLWQLFRTIRMKRAVARSRSWHEPKLAPDSGQDSEVSS